jgi:hypothetical protein
VKTRKTYLAINRLMATLDDCERQLYNIRGLIKQLPADWISHACECGYSDGFREFLEMMFSPSALDKVNLLDFLTAYKSFKKRATHTTNESPLKRR